MKLVALDHPPATGGIQPGCAVEVAGHLAWLEAAALTSATAVSARLEFEGGAPRLVTTGRHALPVDTHLEPGASAPHNSVVGTDPRCATFISGRSRVLIDVAHGEILAQTEAPTDATGPARGVGEQVLVPEGNALTAYDARTLTAVERTEVPDSYSVYATDEDGAAVLLRPLGSQPKVSLSLWFPPAPPIELSDADYAIGPPAAAEGLVVVPAGVGAAATTVAVDRASGAIAWSCSMVRPRSRIGGLPVIPTVLSGEEAVLVAAAWPAIDAREPMTGRLIWRHELSQRPDDAHDLNIRRPTAVAIGDGRAWTATYDGELIAIDIGSGEKIASTYLDALVGNITTAILPILGSSSAIVVGAVGAMTHATLMPV
jgi:PQQ-like domain